MSSLVERRSWKFPHPTLTSYHHLLASLCYLGSLDSLDRLAGAARASVEPCAQAMGYDGLLKQSACCQTTAYHQRNTLLVHAARPHSESVPSLVLAVSRLHGSFDTCKSTSSTPGDSARLYLLLELPISSW